MSDRSGLTSPVGDASRLAEALGVRVVGHGTVATTMELAAEDPGPLPVIHLAERQISGRGRRGRHWESPPGNLHATVAWPDPDAAWPPATLAALQVAWSEAVERAGGPRTGCKWPNDGWIEGRKWAGMVAERSMSGGALLIGMGANLVVAPEGEGFAATALAAHWEGWPGRATVAEMLLRVAVDLLREGPGVVGVYLDRWKDRDIWEIGTEVEVKAGEDVVHGAYRGLAADGALQLESDGRIVVVASGDASNARACRR